MLLAANGSEPRWYIDCAQALRSFTQSLQANADIVPWNRLRPLPPQSELFRNSHNGDNMEGRLELKEKHGSFNRRIFLHALMHLFPSFVIHCYWSCFQLLWCLFIFESSVMSRESARKDFKKQDLGVWISQYLCWNFSRNPAAMCCCAQVSWKLWRQYKYTERVS
jgi:hypothetical protein